MGWSLTHPVRKKEGTGMMLGFGSVEIALAFWLSIGSSILCVIYGIVNWNETGKDKPGEDA